MKNVNQNKKKNLSLILAIITAILMLATAYFLKNNAYESEMINGVFYLWIIPFLYLTKNTKTCCNKD